MPFAYADAPHVRKHGPSGYVRYQSYKDWLRDEFAFRCVYCLERESGGIPTDMRASASIM
jgi:hypothetical protein